MTSSWEGGTGEGDAGRWRLSHAALAFGGGVLASLAASAAVVPGGITVFEAFAVIGGVQTLATTAIVALLRRTAGREPLGLRLVPSDAGGLLVGVGLAVALSWLSYLVVQLLFRGDAPVQSVVQVADEAEGVPTRLAVVVVTVLLAPLAEELVFRGVLLRALDHRFGARAARYGSAVAFSVTHLLLDFDAVLAVPALFIMGLVLASLVQRRGRLGPAVTAHAGFNLVGVLALLFL